MSEYPPTNFMKALKYVDQELIDAKSNRLLVLETVFDDGTLKASFNGKLFPISVNNDDVVLLAYSSDEDRLKEYVGRLVMVKTDEYLVGILEDVSFGYPPVISIRLNDRGEGTRVETLTDFSEVWDMHGNQLYTNPLVRDEHVEKLIGFLKLRKVLYEFCEEEMVEFYERPVHTECEPPLSGFIERLYLVRSIRDGEASQKCPQDPWTN